jgi:uncharacterized membrane protein YdjX (TVP38/TMEM64 family)
LIPARTAGAALIVVAAGGLLWWLLSRLAAYGLGDTVESAEALIASWGPWGVAASIALMVVHSFLPFPAEIIALANGMLYGPLWGSVITWVGAMLGASLAFGLARWLGRPFVLRLLAPERRRALDTWSRERGGLALLVARLIPAIAFNLINYAAALTQVSWWTFLWTTGLGILPLTILLAVLGENILELPAWAWLLAGAIAVLAWFVHRARGQR